MRPKSSSREYLEAVVERVKPLLQQYPPMWETLHQAARASAGGRASPRRMSEMEKMALLALTEENVRDLPDEELLNLHRRTHQLAAQLRSPDS